MKMNTRFKVVALFILLGGCATLLPPEYMYQASLVQQSGGGDACSSVHPGIYTEDTDDEIITVRFGNGFDIVELRPEGSERQDRPVKWSATSYDDKQLRFALLTRPETLLVGNTQAYANKNVCVTFFDAAFKTDELDIAKYSVLSGAECCGVLHKQQIQK